MTGTHHPLLMVLAVFVGVVAAFVAIDFLAHGRTTVGRARTAWLGGGVLTAALGVWSVHFVGMLSLRLRLGAAQVPVGYDLPRMLLPALVAGAAVTIVLGVAGLYGTGPVTRVLGGPVLGAGVVGAHYAAMAALRMPARVANAPPLVLAATAVAVVGGVAVVTAALRVVEATPHHVPQRLGAALLAGAVVAGAHYTAVAGARFTPTGGTVRVTAGQLLATDGVAAFVAAVVLLILGFALLSVTLDRRAHEQSRTAERYSRLLHEAEAARALAEDSERRFRVLADAAPVMVWLAERDGSRTFVGAKWREFIGRPAGPVEGDVWIDSIDVEDRTATLAAYREAMEARRPFRLEYRIRRADGKCCWVLDTGIPRMTGGEFAGYVGACVDITDRREAEEGQQFLLEVARVLATSLDFGAVLRHVTQLLVPRLADYCIVYFRVPEGGYSQVAAAHADPGMTPLLEGLASHHRPVVGNPSSPVARALLGGEPVLGVAPSVDEARAITEDEAALRILGELAPTEYLAVPLVARGERLGVIVLAVSAPGRRFGEQVRLLAEVFAARAALALDNARLYTEARRAGDEAVRASRLEAQLAQARLDALRAQLNPHFLFNALNSIAMLVRRDAKPDALRGIISLSDLLRRSLAGQGALHGPLRAELPLLESYVTIEQLRFRDRLRVTIDAAPDVLDALVPGFLLQPIVENAIKHGVAQRTDAGTVQIRAWRDGESLVLEVADDGPGFPAGWDPTTSGGVGLANTRERLERLYAAAHSFAARSRAEGGAQVTIRIPYHVVPGADARSRGHAAEPALKER